MNGFVSLVIWRLWSDYLISRHQTALHTWPWHIFRPHFCFLSDFTNLIIYCLFLSAGEKAMAIARSAIVIFIVWLMWQITRVIFYVVPKLVAALITAMLMIDVISTAVLKPIAAVGTNPNNQSQQTSSQPADTRYHLLLFVVSSVLCRVIPNLHLSEVSWIYC